MMFSGWQSKQVLTSIIDLEMRGEGGIGNVEGSRMSLVSCVESKLNREGS